MAEAGEVSCRGSGLSTFAGGAEAGEVEAVGGLALGGPGLLELDGGGGVADEQRALLGLEAADGVDEAAAGADAGEAAGEELALALGAGGDVLVAAGPAQLGVAGEVAEAGAGGVEEDGVVAAVVDAGEVVGEEVAVDAGEVEFGGVEGAAEDEVVVGGEAVGGGVGGDEGAGAAHELGEVEGLGAEAAAGVEDMFAGTWREGQGGLLGAEALDGEEALAVERVVGELAAAADAEGLGVVGHGLDLDAGVGGAEGLGDRVGGGAGEVDAEVDGRGLDEGHGAGEGAFGAELFNYSSGVPAGQRPAQGEDVERLAGGEALVEGGAVAVDPGEHGLDEATQGAARVELVAQGLGLGDRHVGGAAELPQLEHGHPQELAQVGAEALGTLGDRVDVGVEPGPVTQHAVDEGGHEAAVAAGQVGAPREQVLGEDAVGEAVALVELAEDANGEAAGAGGLHGWACSTEADTLRAMSVRAAMIVLAATMAGAACDQEAPPELPDNDLLLAVQKAKYDEWARAPGRDERKATLAPHSWAVDIFVNDVVEEALANKDGLGLLKWPEGSTIVLEGYADLETTELAQVAIMQKHHGVWRWEQYQAEDLERPRFKGRPDVCLGCHNTGQDFTRSFSLPDPVEEE